MSPVEPEQRVRVALTLLQARTADRPVPIEEIARELADLPRAQIEHALESLRANMAVQQVRGGWLSRPPPPSADPTRARARAARLFERTRP